MGTQRHASQSSQVAVWLYSTQISQLAALPQLPAADLCLFQDAVEAMREVSVKGRGKSLHESPLLPAQQTLRLHQLAHQSPIDDVM